MAHAVLNILTAEQQHMIDAAVMQLLDEAGMEVAGEAAREVFARAGCRVDGRRIRFPESLVRDSIGAAPDRFEIHGLNPAHTVHIGDGRPHVQPMVGRLSILGADGVRRTTTLDDVARIVRVCDALEHYDILHGGAVMPQIDGAPPGLAHVAGFVATLRNTGKPFKGSCRGRPVAEDCLALARAVADTTGRPFMLHTTCNLVSPLQLPTDMTDGALVYVRAGWPVDFASEPQLGATSPVTLAGTLAQGMAECLAGVVLAQQANPGCPVFVGTVAAAMDMRHATIALGGVEAAILNAAHAQMARFYGLPSRGTGANTNAKQLDFQAGHEKMTTLLLPILAGIDMLFYPGTLEHAETISLESLVLDHDLCGIALKALEGLRVTPALLAVNLVKQVGPGGTFLGLPQTAAEMFNEHLVHGLRDRRRRDDWDAAGRPPPPDVSRDRVRQILEQPVTPLPDAVESAVCALVEAISVREGHPELTTLLRAGKQERMS